jgi:hypothetical protein
MKHGRILQTAVPKLYLGLQVIVHKLAHRIETATVKYKTVVGV